MKDKTHTVRWTEVIERSLRFAEEAAALVLAAEKARTTYGGATLHYPDGKIMLLRVGDRP